MLASRATAQQEQAFDSISAKVRPEPFIGRHPKPFGTTIALEKLKILDPLDVLLCPFGALS